MTGEEVQRALGQLPGWTGGENGIKRHLDFDDFRGAMQFMQACIEGIERLNHHPVWTNKFNAVDIHLDTFDIGHKVTKLDIELATFLEQVLKARGTDFGYVSP